MKYLPGISQGFDKCTNDYFFVQLFNCRTTIFEEHLPVTASALKYDHDIIIIKIVESLKLFWYEEVTERWVEINICYIILFIKKAFQVFQCTEKSFFPILFHIKF